MPELREVFEMTTKQIDPDVGSWRDQQERQRKRARNRKVGAILVAAAIGVAAAVLILTNRPGEGGTGSVPAGDPSSPTTTAEPPGSVGTVTFDGSTCSLELGSEPVEQGALVLDAVNTSDGRVMFDTWELVNGYTYQEFATAIERIRMRNEKGKVGRHFPEGAPGPDQQVNYLGRGEIIRANTSGLISATASAGTHAIVCLKPYEGLGLGPAGITDPFDVR